MAISRAQMGKQLQGNRTMKKYQAGGMMKDDPMRPKMRPKKRPGGAPAKSMRPKMRSERDESMSTENAVGRGNRSAMREAMEMPKMKKGGKVKKMMGGGMAKTYKAGGKVRGCGMARGGAVRQCKMVKMKGS